MTPERIEQERMAFEEWYASTYLPTPVHGRTFYKYSTGVYRLQHVQDAWQAWQARAAQSEWISVDDGYPENGQEVNILLNTGEVRIALHEVGTPGGRDFTKGHYFTGDIYHIDGAEYNCSLYGDNVTHWQPLPAPPTTNPAA